MKETKIPRFLKFGFASFLAIMVPVYWIKYGPTNFLWFSDVTLFLAFFAVITERRIFASMAAVGGLVLESFWNLNYFLTLFFNVRLTSLTDYMFEDSYPMWLRAISLFHVALPPLVIWLVVKLGYDRRAWVFQTVLGLTVVAMTWLLTDPERNINWVFSYQKIKWVTLPPINYLAIEGGIIALVFALTHSFLMILSRKKALRGVKNPIP